MQNFICHNIISCVIYPYLHLFVSRNFGIPRENEAHLCLESYQETLLNLPKYHSTIILSNKHEAIEKKFVKQCQNVA